MFICEIVSATAIVLFFVISVQFSGFVAVFPATLEVPVSDIPWSAACSGTPPSAACGDDAVGLSVVGEFGDGERVSDFRFRFCGDVVSCPFVKLVSCPFVKSLGGP